MDKISKKDARNLALSTQGLLGKNDFGNGEDGVHRMIERIGYVQIDSISVIERAHHHVIRSRVNGYSPKILDQLQTENRRIFEYWSHAAAYLPLSYYRFSLPQMHYLREGGFHWFQREPKLMAYVQDRIRAEGPLRAKDFEAPKDHQSGPWWNWKPAKKALEQLFMEGHLMVVRREKFQKVYELTERVLPADLDTRVPTAAETAAHLIGSTIHAHGFAAEAEMTYLRRNVKADVKKALPEMVENKEIVPITVEDLSDVFYTFPQTLETPFPKSSSKKVRFLSPFDNAIIQRNRALKIFDFNYQLECYVPKPKRKYGYFSLPILYGNRFVGRMDSKADRPNKTLLVQNLVLEENFRGTDVFFTNLKKALNLFAREQNCETIQMIRTNFERIKEVFSV